LLSIGLDVGGANIKMAVCRAATNRGKGIEIQEVSSTYFPFWKQHRNFPDTIGSLLEPYGGRIDNLLVTTTAELSDCFKSKAEGVRSVLAGVAGVVPDAKVLLNSGDVVGLDTGLEKVDAVAAANWVAPALLTGQHHPQALLIDSGSTTTDITPIVDGEPAVNDPSDMGRMIDNQLVYTGATRTNVATVTDKVILDRKMIPVASEYFATMADVNLLLGNISPGEYSVPTADNRGISKTECMRRLSRVVCADLNTLPSRAILTIAEYIHRKQVDRVAASVEAVVRENDLSPSTPCIVAGSGIRSLAGPAARAAGLTRILIFGDFLARSLDVSAPRKQDISASAPAVALCILANRGML